MNELHHDQEVARKPHLVDNVEFEIQTLVVGPGNLRALRVIQRFMARFFTGIKTPQTRIQAVFADLTEKILHRDIVRHRVIGQIGFTQLQLQIAAHGDGQRILYRLRNVTEQLLHLCRAAQVLLFGVVMRAARIIQRAALVDADAHLVGLEILRIQEAHIVGGNHGTGAGCRKTDCLGDVVFLAIAPAALQLQIETVWKPQHPLRQ